ncbi:uncharacterized protein N7498_004237 [Penicillium cinerascens]|uniref:Zn(2)-C6 fungal-type domain-containing protein n=1 Tax=Penicillium cinerascens TaxID=70096 RepID=A0A9W9N3M7_9EURO|nr:uncharacterized protein N7498_004237 [Penicillium cinerascens]KAJ5212591.1 hypothetical protein N7498_004237 [Penicillium cinerascens]
MVGVGGRSKGCKTCRRRRVKCDEVKPHCERCRKAKLQCEGYNQYAEFIDVTTRLTGKSLPNDKKSAAVSPAGSTWPGDSVIELPCMPLIRNPAFDEQIIFTSHLINRLFSWHQESTSPESAAWILSLTRHTEDEGDLSTSSLRALATAYFGKTHGHSELVRKGAGFYSRALTSLRRQLQDPNLVLEDEVLVAIICMGIYELVTFNQPNGWLHHWKGLARLTALRGPHRFQSGIAHALFPSLRSCIALGYIVERKRCFLEDPEWKTIPWAINGLDSKMPVSHLHDHLSDLPGFLEDMDRVIQWPPGKPGLDEFKAACSRRIFATLQAVYAWRWKWEQKFPNSTYLIASDNVDREAVLGLPPAPFKSIIWFASANRATELILYNSIRLVATRALEISGIHMDVPLSGTNPTDPLLPMQGCRRDVAVEICRMVNYHLHNLRRSSGALMVLFPVNVAYINLEDDREGARPWLERVMAVVADIHGFEIGRKENLPRKTLMVRDLLKHKS